MDDSNIEERPLKVARISEDSSAFSSLSICESLTSFEGFKLTRVLKENPENKLIALEGTFNSSDSETSVEPAVILLEKTHFGESDLHNILSSSKTSLEKVFCNDIYGNFSCYPPPELNPIKATIIHPATAKHIAKYSARPGYMVEETAEAYNSVTLPYITDSKLNVEVT